MLTWWSHLSARKKKRNKRKEKEGVRGGGGGKQASWAAARLLWAPGRPSWADAVLFSLFFVLNIFLFCFLFCFISFANIIQIKPNQNLKSSNIPCNIPNQ
jgi:hypothetical protein